MKILFHYHDSLSKISGTPLRILSLARAFQELGHEVILASPGDVISGFHHITFSSSFFGKYFHIFSLFRVLRTLHPDVVYSFTSLSLLSSLPAARFARKRLCVEIHGLWFEESAFKGRKLRSGSLFMKFLAACDRFLVHCADAVYPICSSLADYYRSSSCEPHTIFLGVDIHAFSPTVVPFPDLISFKRNRVLVMYAGNFNTYQGVDLLFDVITCLPSGHLFCFAFLGNDSDLPTDLPRDIVYSCGKVPYASVPAYLAASDILVIPRLASPVATYSFPSKLLEYMAMGKTVLVTRVGSMEDLVSSGTHGLVVEPSVEGLLNGLLRLRSSSVRKKMSLAARKTAEQYSLQKNARRIIDLLS